MRNIKKVLIISQERLNNSVNGNPRYIFTYKTEEGDYIEAKTASDAGFVY